MTNLGNKKIMAANIQKYMKKFGISRRKLSDDLNIKYTTLTDWIKGNTYPRIDKIEMMANYFNIQKSDLIEDNNHFKKQQEIDLSKDRDDVLFTYQGRPIPPQDMDTIRRFMNGGQNNEHKKDH